MEQLIKLDLHSDSERVSAESRPKAERMESPSQARSKKLNRIFHKATHKGITVSGQSGPGMFTK